MIDKEKVIDELEKLEEEGSTLCLSLYKTSEEGLAEIKKRNFNLDKIPDFAIAYEDWYTKSYRLISKIAPFRLKDFISLYK